MIKFIKDYGENKAGDQVLNHPEEDTLIENGTAEKIEKFDPGAEAEAPTKKKK